MSASTHAPVMVEQKDSVAHDEIVGGHVLPSPPSASAPQAVADVSPWNRLGWVETMKLFRKTTLLCVLAGFNACSDGFQFSLPGQIIANTGFIKQVGVKSANGTYALDTYNVSAWGGIYTGGYIAALLIATYPNDKLGRKFNLICIQLFLAIACILEMLTTDWRMWAAAKLFDGFSIGFNQATLSTYISELAPTNARGSLLAVYQLWFTIGQFSAAIALEILSLTTPLEWKKAVYSEWVFTGLALIIWFFLPESPRWLASKGKHDRARAILTKLNGSIEGYDVDREYAILLQEIEDGERLIAAGKQMSYSSLFRGTNLRRTLLSFGPFAWQTWLGVPIIFGYTSLYFSEAGLSKPFLGTVAVYLILLVFVIISFWSVERLGRRPLLLVGGAVCVVAMLVNGAVATQKMTTTIGSVIISMACLWCAAYALSAGPLGYVYLGEMSTVVLRAKTTGVAAAMTGLLNLITSYCVPILLSATAANWGVKGTSFFFAGTGAVGWVMVYFFVPETRGRSYLELDELFERRIPARKFASTQTSVETVSDVSRKGDEEA